MNLSQKVQDLINDFIDADIIDAVKDFSSSQENLSTAIDLIGKMFGFSGNFSEMDEENQKKLLKSFKNNLQLLIQKTWVEKSDIALKEQILFRLENSFEFEADWCVLYNSFLDIINSSVYLMFGQQTKTEDFCEYSLRIDPEFGIFWWYIQSLPPKTDWSQDKCRTSVLLGMYFLANY